MQRFFFDTSEGGRETVDSTGIELADRLVARRAAIKTLPLMAADALPDGDSHEFSVTVRDEAGRSIYEAKLVLSGGWIDPDARAD